MSSVENVSSSLAGHISEESAAAPSSNVVESGDWTCSDESCKNVNFERRTQCNKCQRERSVEKSILSGGGVGKKKLGTEIGKVAAEKSRGLFSAEDWQCSKCANVNWARRQTCNMCNAPKFCDVEERTGYGGGYNDRGIVEYKDRSESDSDYDEFGRLKKRTVKKFYGRNDSEMNAEARELAREYDGFDDEEDEDDDDEDEGDGDLSKYDLWGDDEVVNASKNALKEKNANSRARSPNSQPKQSRKNSTSHSRSSSSSSSSSSTSKSNEEIKKRRKDKSSRSRSKSRNRTRNVSKTHSIGSSKNSNRKNSKSRSRSRSSSKINRRRVSTNQTNSHSSSSSSRSRNSKPRTLKSKSRTRSRSNSRTRPISIPSKSKRNFSRSPEPEKPDVSSRYRRRSRSNSPYANKRRR